MNKQFDIINEFGEVVGMVAIDAQRACYVADVHGACYGFFDLKETTCFLWELGLDIA